MKFMLFLRSLVVWKRGNWLIQGVSYVHGKRVGIKQFKVNPFQVNGPFRHPLYPLNSSFLTFSGVAGMEHLLKILRRIE